MQNEFTQRTLDLLREEWTRDSVALTDAEICALIQASEEARTIVNGMSPAAQTKYKQTAWWSALDKLENELKRRGEKI